jgi:uncharacterized protein YutE (UPF0331/DUF86 family)
MCLHVATEDFGYEPESYSDCFTYLQNKGIIICAEDLVKMIRLRNLLVHRYWIVDDLKVYASIEKNFKCTEDLLKASGERYGVSV